MNMEAVLLPSDDPDYFDSLDTNISHLCTYLDSFYETLESMKSSEKDEKYLEYILDMQSLIEASLNTYLFSDEEEMKEFLDLSQAKKAVKLEEVLRHE